MISLVSLRILYNSITATDNSLTSLRKYFTATADLDHLNCTKIEFTPETNHLGRGSSVSIVARLRAEQPRFDS
jgi:hypothetical protein